MGFNWEQAIGSAIGGKIQSKVNDKNFGKVKDRKSSKKPMNMGSFQEFLPFKTIVNGILVHADGCTFSSYIRVGRVNFDNKNDDSKELILSKYDEVLNITDNGQIYLSKGKINAELILHSMEKNKNNLVGFEREFYDIQKEHYEKEIYKRDITSTQRLIILNYKVNRGTYEEKLQKAIKHMSTQQLAYKKKLQEMNMNLIHFCNTYDVLEVIFGSLTNELNGSLVDKLKVPSSGVFVTKVNEANDNNHKDMDILETKGNDLLAVGEWDFKDLLISTPVHFAEEYIKLGKKFIGVRCITEYSDNITEKTFKDILNQNEYDMVFSMHIEKQNKADVISTTQSRLNAISRKNITDSRNKESRSIDSDKLKGALIKLNDDTQNFLVKIYFGIIANTLEEMEHGVEYISKELSSKSIYTYSPDYEMEVAFLSLLPIGNDAFDKKLGGSRIGENILTKALACINIFSGTDLVHTTSRSLRYGYDRDTNSYVVADKVKYNTSPASLILGVPGAGKSAAAKHEIGEAILTAPVGDQIVAIDYIGEYTPFCIKFGYPEVVFTKESKNYINCMDLNPYSETPLIEKADRFVEFLSILLNKELSNSEENAIDKAFYNTYAEYGITEGEQCGFFDVVDKQIGDNTVFGTKNSRKVYKLNENIPILGDFQKHLKLVGSVGEAMADDLDIYVKGTLSYLNKRTTLDINARFTNVNLRNVRSKMKPALFYLVKEKLHDKGVYNFQTRNKQMIWLYYDEMHKYFRIKKLGEYLANDYKEGRKEGLIPCGITQNPPDLIKHEDGILCLINAKFIILLGMDKKSRESIGEYIELSEAEKNAFNGDVTTAGDGLLVFGGDRIPIHITCSEWELEHFDTTAH